MIFKVFFQPLKLSPIFTIIRPVYLGLNKLQLNAMFHNFVMDTQIHVKFSHHIQNMSQGHIGLHV